MDEYKFDQLVGYVCGRCLAPKLLSIASLNWILWYSDLLAFADEGRAISGTGYFREENGPVSRDVAQAVDRLTASGMLGQRDVVADGCIETRLVALKEADFSVFSVSQIGVVNRVLEAIGSGSGAGIFGPAYDIVWQCTEVGEDIPMAAAAFGGRFGELDQKDIDWAQAEIARIERLGVSV